MGDLHAGRGGLAAMTVHTPSWRQGYADAVMDKREDNAREDYQAGYDMGWIRRRWLIRDRVQAQCEREAAAVLAGEEPVD